MCDSTPLKPLVSYCSSILAFLESLQEKDNDKVALVKQKHTSRAEDDISDASTSASDVNLALFSGDNIQEVVKMLKSAVEPLHQVLAETEELLVKDPSAYSSSSQQKYDTAAAKLKTEFGKCTRALSAVKRTGLTPDVRNCSVDVERLDMSLSKETLSGSRHIVCNSVADENSKLKKSEDFGSNRVSNSVKSSTRASRADIEAQRDLHQQMLSAKDESSESDSSGNESSSTSSEEEEEDTNSSSSDDDAEYDPKSDIRQVKLERGRERRTTAKKTKMRAGN